MSEAKSSAPRPLSLVGIALACGFLGFGIARASLDVDRAAQANEAGRADEVAPEGSEEGSSDALPATTGPAGLEGAAIDASAEAMASATDAGAASEVEPVSETAIEPEIVPEGGPEQAEIAPNAGTAGSTHVETGRVAYIRCEGTPDAACPRDVGVERRAWDAIRTLDRCEALRGQVGEADLRIVFDGGRYSGIGFRDGLRNGLDEAALRTCLEDRMRELRSTHPASRMTVAFRFSLVR